MSGRQGAFERPVAMIAVATSVAFSTSFANCAGELESAKRCDALDLYHEADDLKANPNSATACENPRRHSSSSEP
jgi:hypothetical protein